MGGALEQRDGVSRRPSRGNRQNRRSRFTRPQRGINYRDFARTLARSSVGRTLGSHPGPSDRAARRCASSDSRRGDLREVCDRLTRGDLNGLSRDALSGDTGFYLSNVSNRQNDLMKQLTGIATICLPFASITELGHNPRRYRQSPDPKHLAFVVIGIRSMLATCIGLLAYFRRKRRI